VLVDVWHQLIGVQPQPPGWLVLVSGVLALLSVASSQIWPLSRNVVTIAHEGGHALLALITGRRLHGIRLHSDTSGVTISAGKPTGPGVILMVAAGYVTPSLLGLGGAWLLTVGRITALLWLSLLLLVGILALIRNAFGVLSVLLTGLAVFVVCWFTSEVVQAAFAYLIIWFLLFAGTRPVAELQHKRRLGEALDSDADQLARLTGVPAVAWVLLFALVALIALLIGGRWMVMA
jgi:Peptidase M50B-like